MALELICVELKPFCSEVDLKRVCNGSTVIAVLKVSVHAVMEAQQPAAELGRITAQSLAAKYRGKKGK